MSVLIGVVEEMGRRGAEEVAVEWKIPNFPPLLHGRDGDWYYSPTFRLGNGSWYLRMCPNYKREAGNPASGWVMLALVRCDAGPAATVRFSVGIRGSGGVEKSREGEKEFKNGDRYYLWDDFCSRSYLLEHRTRLMPDDTLTIRCVLKRPGAARAAVFSHPHSSNQVAPTNRSQSSDKQDACTQTDCNVEAEVQESTVKRDACAQTDCNLEAEVLTEVEQSSVKRGCEKLSEDIAKLLASGEDSDVTVQVGDVEFKVHRNILSARSPVLAAMFRHETEERTSNSIKINDCDPDVFRQYLQYLYTGPVGLLSEQNVFLLYRVADKYLADELKEQCLMHIRDTLSVQTFCDTIKVALTHGESALLEEAIDFATENIRSIIRTVEWQNFIREYPTEANEVLIKSLGPPESPSARRKSKR